MNNKSLYKLFRQHPKFNRFSGLLAVHGVSREKVCMAVYANVLEVIDGLLPGAKYTTEQLCGPELWGNWPTHGQHRAMGIALSMLVEMGVLPLVCVTPDHINNKKYSLRLAAK